MGCSVAKIAFVQSACRGVAYLKTADCKSSVTWCNFPCNLSHNAGKKRNSLQVAGYSYFHIGRHFFTA